MPLILRAIITGFGYKLGAELARYLGTRAGLIPGDKAKTEEKGEDIPDGITHVPGDDDGDGQPPEGDARCDDA